MFEFQQFLGFLAALVIITIGFWLMIFLILFLPYWITGHIMESMKARKKQKELTDSATS